MTRRGIVAGFVLVVLWAWVGHAQQAAKTIGFLGASSADTAGPWVAAFVRRLRELGWIEGKNVTIEYCWAEARTERYSEIAAELASRNVDVIVTWASAPVLAAKHTTTTIPIVFAAQMDPVGAGVVASLARPLVTLRACPSNSRHRGQAHRTASRDYPQARAACRDGKRGCTGRDAGNAGGREDGTQLRT